MWFFPFSKRNSSGKPFESNGHGLLVVNNEFGGHLHVIGKNEPESLDDVRVSQYAHGVTIVEIRKFGRKWQTVTSRYSRRIHANSLMTFSGPTAGHELLQTINANVPLGTLNNCAPGVTPWVPT